MESTIEQAAPGEFAAARRELEKLIAELGELSQQVREHGEIEQRIGERGNEIMRLLMQDYLDRVAQAEHKLAHVEGADGRRRRYARVRKRTLMTRFGEVVVTRLGYSDHGQDSVYPLDAHLNLPLEKYSHGLRERAGEMAATASFEATVEHIERHTGGFVPKRQAEEVVRKLATDFRGGPGNSDSGISGCFASQSRRECRTQEQKHDQKDKTEPRRKFQGQSGAGGVAGG